MKMIPYSLVATYVVVFAAVWSAEREKEFKAAAAQEIEDALVEAQKAPPAQPSQIFDNVFAELTPRQAAQRREMLGRD